MPAAEGFFNAAPARDNANGSFHKAHDDIAMRDDFVGMDNHFITAPKGEARWCGNHRNRGVAHRFNSHLEVKEETVNAVKIFRPDHGEERVKVNPCREMLGIVMNDDAFAVIFSRSRDDFHRSRGKRIGFGMEFNEAKVVINGIEAGGRIVFDRG